MNLLDQYGIKEVADVTIYSIHKKDDGSGDVYYVPALYLDTLKISTVEKSADNTWAQGGLGNSRLVGWDYGKTINLNFEDALCTPASLGMCWGGVLGADWKDGQINQNYGINDLRNCGTERISRMEKAFYPRNDTVNATISNLLPRDGTEDILYDQSGDPVYLSRSSVIDGTQVKGFGYVKGHPYKWNLEIESSIKSIAVVPDRFFSIYGKTYPIKRIQTVGINQPSESFKYEIIYKRGYDKYDMENPIAKIIYHKQAEMNIQNEYTCQEDKDALKLLDDFDGYPYLKIRVCHDNSIKAYLGTEDVLWNWEMEDIEEVVNNKELYKRYWIEIPQIDTTQFEGIDLWLRFDSINALSYYLITKYEDNIFAIGPKKIWGGLADSGIYTFKQGYYFNNIVNSTETRTDTFKISLRNMSYTFKEYNQSTATWGEEQTFTVGPYTHTTLKQMKISVKHSNKNPSGSNNFEPTDISAQSAGVAWIKFLMSEPKGIGLDIDEHEPEELNRWIITEDGTQKINLASIDLSQSEDIYVETTSGNQYILVDKKPRTQELAVDEVAGKDYSLEMTDWETFGDSACTPCCKKANLSRALWAYVNPKTMQPYDDDYWFHQGEAYYKKSLTLSTKEAPVKAQRIYVNQGVFPGMYKIVGETYIRSRDTGEDERVQLSFPLCKIKSNQTLTLQAEGDPTTFNFEVEVANPENGIPMEITFYEVEKDFKKGCGGSLVEKDGSTRISAK